MIIINECCSIMHLNYIGHTQPNCCWGKNKCTLNNPLSITQNWQEKKTKQTTVQWQVDLLRFPWTKWFDSTVISSGLLLEEGIMQKSPLTGDNEERHLCLFIYLNY